MERPERYGAPDPEKLDPTPIEMPIGCTRPTPLAELIAQMVRQAVEAETADEFETMEESDDFSEEDPDTLDLSPYTLSETEPEPIDSAILEPEPVPPTPTGDPPDPNAEETDPPD